MPDFTLFDANKIKTLDQYAAALLSSMISLRSLYALQGAAYSQGIFNQEEEETCKTILWEIKRLIGLYSTQFDQISTRCAVDEATILKSLECMVKKPKRKKKNAIPQENL